MCSFRLPPTGGVPRPFRPRAALVLLGASLLSAGCGDDRLPTFPVRGTVTVEGRPLPTGTITFIPLSPGPYASAEIGPNGTYELTTYADEDGAVAGAHRVMVNAVEVDPNHPEAKPLIPSRYGVESTSGLTAEVREAGENVADFDLKSK